MNIIITNKNKWGPVFSLSHINNYAESFLQETNEQIWRHLYTSLHPFLNLHDSQFCKVSHFIFKNSSYLELIKSYVRSSKLCLLSHGRWEKKNFCKRTCLPRIKSLQKDNCPVTLSLKDTSLPYYEKQMLYSSIVPPMN